MDKNIILETVVKYIKNNSCVIIKKNLTNNYNDKSN